MADASQEAQQTQNGRHDGGNPDHGHESGQKASGARDPADREPETQGEALGMSHRVLQSGIEAATHHARSASERMM